MIHNGHLPVTTATIHLGRLFGGLWAFKPFSLHHGAETFPAVTDALGDATVRLVPSSDPWTVEADHKVLGTFTAGATDFRVSYVL